MPALRVANYQPEQATLLLILSVVNVHFCYACATACPEPIFLPKHSQPWDISISIGQNCLAYLSIECRRCQDSCEPEVIFRPSMAGIYQPKVETPGCGACVAGCPVSAITVEHEHAQ